MGGSLSTMQGVSFRKACHYEDIACTLAVPLDVALDVIVFSNQGP